jgi:2,3-bisphosphoglycerate-independent phosphoglycerate mutase
MRVILIVGDGMADLPIADIGNRTPLEVANPTNMHRLASKGCSGLLDLIVPGVVPGTEAAHLSLLGYDPQIAQGGRGPFEAAGTGIELCVGDLAFRCNFATINNDFLVLDERAGRIGSDAIELAKTLQTIKLKKYPNVQIIFRQALGFKAALVLRGEGLSPNVYAPMPKQGDLVAAIRPKDSTTEALRTAEILNEVTSASYALLKNHPINSKRKLEGKPEANAIIPWSGGLTPVLSPFSQKYGLNAACVAAASVIKGIGKLCGMTVIDVKGATGELNTDVLAKAEAALTALRTHDFVLLHVEAADEASHDGDILGKISIIKKIDSMVGQIIDNVDLSEVLIVLVSDHVTSTKLRVHTDDPVPIVIAGCHFCQDAVIEYNEKAALKGSLKRLQGNTIMPLIMNLFNKP